VLDYDAKSGGTATIAADALIADIRARGLKVDWIIETHVHADHLSSAQYIKQVLGGRIGIGARVSEVQSIFSRIFNAEPAFATDGSQFDHLFEDGETFRIGSLTAIALATPGHTRACMSFHIGDAVFTGDAIFMPDSGTGRCDFPGGDAARLFHSIQRLFALPPQTRVFVGHDYQPGGRDLRYETTIAVQRMQNLHVRDGIDEADFVAMRRARDTTLDLPNLILPAVQVNMRAGQLPPPESNGMRYIKIPINQF